MRNTITSPVQALTPLQSLLLRRWRPQWACPNCRRRQEQQVRSLATSSNPTKPYYVTTPIFYVNAAPHVGHMYTMLLADVLKRWQALKSRQSILLTGTDEHGLKIQQAAAKAKIPPKDFCDSGAEVFKTLAGKIDVGYDRFIRTTDARHREGVEYAWQMLQEKGWIYESKHEGWYSVSDETFYPKGQVQVIVEPKSGRKMMVSIETGKQVEWTSERNYHFRLSAFREKLLEFYEKNSQFVVPRARMAEVVAEVSAGLMDLSVSRPHERLQWGIRVPTDESQTIYVWLDALLNYATAAGYPFTPGSEQAGGWPADVHVIGKDILRFHCIYWPAFLMALDLPLPKQVLTHAHWTLGKQKMAKSAGNGVNPFFALDRFGIDAMRWYLIHDGGITDDADYDNGYIVEKYKKGLQGGLGNLVSRIVKGKGWDIERAIKRHAHPDFSHKEGSPPVHQGSNSYDRQFYGDLKALPAHVDRLMSELLPNRALQRIMTAVYGINTYLQQSSPWTLYTQLRDIASDTTGNLLHELHQRGSSPESLEAEMDRHIYLAVEHLRLVSILLQPFIPGSASRLLDMLAVKSERRGWEWAVAGKDDEYGVSSVALGRGEGVLFPKLVSEF
ncbi:putative methionyl-tRNA synthetase [Teratosphaeria destructans]|uniref:Probable methionine--tRNA ligase, mitochondrial n=1 Tax=Teratosphaeria destructans TaxID=418781 RepID=A0A9W7T156_9PEZI|nr:putative methionyl-tRNA synthetase [Teratosphaeria destructans]